VEGRLIGQGVEIEGGARTEDCNLLGKVTVMGIIKTVCAILALAIAVVPMNVYRL